MKADPIVAYFTKHHVDCCKNLKAYTQSATSDRLHKLRVSIKKIKAVFNLTADLDGLDVEAYYGPYRQIFQQAGKIRETTISRDKLGELSSDKKAIARCKQQIAVLNKKFKSEIPAHLKAIKQYADDLVSALRQYNFDIPSYFSKLLKKTEKKWNKTRDSGNYHSLRGKFKQLLYVSSMLSAEERKKVIAKKELKHIDELQDLIGVWHDDVDISSHILSDIKDGPQVERTLKAETKKMRKEIVRKGDKLWK